MPTPPGSGPSDGVLGDWLEHSGRYCVSSTAEMSSGSGTSVRMGREMASVGSGWAMGSLQGVAESTTRDWSPSTPRV